MGSRAIRMTDLEIQIMQLHVPELVIDRYHVAF